jgi:ABC-type multidrug transport system permease subunit
MFPRDTMPGPLFVMSHVIPVTYFMQILRGIIVRGAGLTDVLPSLVGLLVITTVLLGVSALRFRKSAS